MSEPDPLSKPPSPVEADTERFAQSYSQVYFRFHRRVPPQVRRLSREALAVLRHLRRSGPLTVTEAAEHFDRSQAAMSEIVQRLERRGVIERIADERDRRRTLVWLSPSGLEAVDAAERVLSDRLLTHALAQMSAADRRKLMEGLEALLNTRPHERGYDDE